VPLHAGGGSPRQRRGWEPREEYESEEIHDPSRAVELQALRITLVSLQNEAELFAIRNCCCGSRGCRASQAVRSFVALILLTTPHPGR